MIENRSVYSGLIKEIVYVNRERIFPVFPFGTESFPYIASILVIDVFDNEGRKIGEEKFSLNGQVNASRGEEVKLSYLSRSKKRIFLGGYKTIDTLLSVRTKRLSFPIQQRSLIPMVAQSFVNRRTEEHFKGCLRETYSFPQKGRDY